MTGYLQGTENGRGELSKPRQRGRLLPSPRMRWKRAGERPGMLHH